MGSEHSMRKRLALIALGPLVALCLLGLIVVLANRSTASLDDLAGRRVALAQSTTQLFDHLTNEAIVNQQAVHDDGVALGAAREATNAAQVTWMSQVTEFVEPANEVLVSLSSDGLADYRFETATRFGGTQQDAATTAATDLSLLRNLARLDAQIANAGQSSVAADLVRNAELLSVKADYVAVTLEGLIATNFDVGSASVESAVLNADRSLTAYSLRAPTSAQVSVAPDVWSSSVTSLADGTVELSSDEWSTAAGQYLDSFSETRASGLQQAGQATAGASSSGSIVRNAALLIFAGLLIAALTVFAVSRSWIKATKVLSDDAHDLASRELPRLRDALITGQALGGGTRDRDLDRLSGGEFGDVADGLIAIRRSTADFGRHVGDLRTGVSDTFVNLARRNQALLDRQLEAIDILEAKERDSDRLALLYRVDHLATRMRRNAESLLVLAGATTPQRRSPAVELREVLRVAIGEVEDYRRIIPISLDPLDVAGHLAQDLAHLIAELMENAAQHSAPGTAVDVLGALESDGSYTIRVIDRGSGIDATRRGELNSLLSSPPARSLTIAQSIGMHVVSRLAQRLCVGVFLASGDDGGTAASVTVPAQVVAEWAREGKENGFASVGSEGSRPVQAAAAVETTHAPSGAAVELAPLALPDVPAAPLAGPAASEDPIPDVAPAEPTLTGVELDSADDVQPSMPSPVEGSAELSAPVEAAPALPVEIPQPKPTTPAIAQIPEALQPLPMGRTAPVNIAAPAEPLPAPAPEFPQTAPVTQAISHTFEESLAVEDAPPSSLSKDKPLPESNAPNKEVANLGGLTRRQRSAPAPAEPDAEARTAPSRRSPDQVRSMLSRYKTGLERGRTIEEDDIS